MLLANSPQTTVGSKSKLNSALSHLLDERVSTTVGVSRLCAKFSYECAKCNARCAQGRQYRTHHLHRTHSFLGSAAAHAAHEHADWTSAVLQCACRNKTRRPLRTRASFQPFINPITIPPTKVLRWCRTCEQSSSHHILPALKLGITACSAVLGWRRLENPGILPARPARCTRHWVALEYHRSFHRQTGQPQSRSIKSFHQPWHAWHNEGSLSRQWQFAPHWRPRSAPERQIIRIDCNNR